MDVSLLEGQHRAWRVGYSLLGKDLPLVEVLHLGLAKSKADFSDCRFSDALELVKTVRLDWFRVHNEVVVRNNDFLGPLFSLLLFHCFFFSHHVVATSEYSLEELGVREGINALNFAYEVSLAFVLRSVDFLPQAAFRLGPLPMVGVLELIELGHRRFLWVGVVVLFLVENIEACLGLPLCFPLGLFIGSEFVFVYLREGQVEIVLGVGVEVIVVVGNVLAELLFLKLPNVQFLA